MKYLLVFTFLVASFNMYAQDTEQYEIQGAKLGSKIARQITESSFESTVTTNRVTTDHGFGRGDNTGNHRLTSFVGAMDGAVVGSLAQNYSYQNYYHGPRNFNYRKKSQNSTDISALEIANITYADEDGDGLLSKNECAQIYFDLINTGDKPLYGIVPVMMVDKTKYVDVSAPVTIDTLKSHQALRYIIELVGKNPSTGMVHLVLRIKYGADQYADMQEICLGTRRKRE